MRRSSSPQVAPSHNIHQPFLHRALRLLLVEIPILARHRPVLRERRRLLPRHGPWPAVVQGARHRRRETAAVHEYDHEPVGHEALHRGRERPIPDQGVQQTIFRTVQHPHRIGGMLRITRDVPHRRGRERHTPGSGCHPAPRGHHRDMLHGRELRGRDVRHPGGGQVFRAHAAASRVGIVHHLVQVRMEPDGVDRHADIRGPAVGRGILSRALLDSVDAFVDAVLSDVGGVDPRKDEDGGGGGDGQNLQWMPVR
mmetsp:Transcript_28441/g.68479  ORF Transcript_28441/g.68479 Transcript_28441/m.68479 type:complete len:254 (+) Transcript_28441:459-1220(+)